MIILRLASLQASRKSGLSFLSSPLMREIDLLSFRPIFQGIVLRHVCSGYASEMPRDRADVCLDSETQALPWLTVLPL